MGARDFAGALAAFLARGARGVAEAAARFFFAGLAAVSPSEEVSAIINRCVESGGGVAGRGERAAGGVRGKSAIQAEAANQMDDLIAQEAR